MIDRSFYRSSPSTIPREITSPNLPHDGIHSLGKVLDVVGVQAGHADAAVLGHVDVELLPEPQDLGLGQAGVAEHTDLVGDVVPVARGAQLGEPGTQGRAHAENAARHGTQVLLPLGEEGDVVEDGGGDAGAVDGRIANLGALQDGQLRSHAGDGLARRGLRGATGGRGHEVEAAGTLAIEAEVFGEGLGDNELEALLDEIADGARVTVEISRSKTLVGGVEEGKVVLLADHLGDLAPLLLGGVDAGGVVGAGMEKDDTTVWGGGDGSLHAVDIEAFCLLVKVRVGGDGHAHVGEDLIVVGPCWVGEVDSAVAGVEPVEEEGAQVASASAGNGLDTGDTLLGDGSGVWAEEELAGLAGEGGKAGDREVLVVKIGVVADYLVGLDLGAREGLLLTLWSDGLMA